MINHDNKDIAKSFLLATDCHIATKSEAEELLKELDSKTYDSDWGLFFDFDGEEWRVIEEDDIDEIWTESLIEQVKEIYDLSEAPSFVEIDWEKTAENCKVDGMGHHFSPYDGNEYSANNYYFFRTN